MKKISKLLLLATMIFLVFTLFVLFILLAVYGDQKLPEPFEIFLRYGFLLLPTTGVSFFIAYWKEIKEITFEIIDSL